mgnify:FL=1
MWSLLRVINWIGVRVMILSWIISEKFENFGNWLEDRLHLEINQSIEDEILNANNPPRPFDEENSHDDA